MAGGPQSRGDRDSGAGPCAAVIHPGFAPAKRSPVTGQAATPADLALLEPLTALIAEAAAAVAAFRVDDLKARLKADQSPVTLADEAAHTVIVDGLARLMPGMPVVSEESREHALPAGADAFVLVDPLDGTKDFLAGRDEFTVNIALLRA